MSYLVKAINNLKPGAEFSFTEDDYLTIKWDVLDGEAPTEAEIKAEIDLIKKSELKAESDFAKLKAAAKANLIAGTPLTAEQADAFLK